ncbi:MAG: ATP-binding cassette domain-containing protein [Chloroflexi bacterium]|nr:ATP-binding cassette domain-containing protein [Chloroflexota bacterium]MCH7656378.1 ATP-binding cassette domain-containing protein [Chloroflexota bacterium]
MNSITVEGLGKRFKDVEAVKDVSFAVAEGEIFGFLGPNGAGKTTTINMLCTLLRPTSGTATVNGYDVVRQRKEVRRSLGLIFQETTLDDYLTAEQNLLFHAYAYSVPKSVREPRMKELLTMLELWDRRKESVATYSGGMRRRLEIARGLLHHPKVLFLDEPTLGLDPQTRRHIWRYILDLRERENLTFFMTTHYMDEAEHCDRIAVIDQGRIVALDTPDNLKDALGGDVLSLRSENNEAAMLEIRERYDLQPQLEDGQVVFNVPRGEQFLPEFVRRFGQRLLSVGIRRPTLEDVFLKLTGHAIRDEEASPAEIMRRRWGGRR